MNPDQQRQSIRHDAEALFAFPRFLFLVLLLFQDPLVSMMMGSSDQVGCDLTRFSNSAQ